MLENGGKPSPTRVGRARSTRHDIRLFTNNLSYLIVPAFPPSFVQNRQIIYIKYRAFKS